MADHVDLVHRAGHQHLGASIRLSLSALDRSFGEGGSIVFYAEKPGAFVDLAADLSDALGVELVIAPPPVAVDGDRHPDGEDGPRSGGAAATVTGRASPRHDLPPVSRESGLFGLAEYSTINRAVGILIADGHAPTDGHLELRRRAASAGLEPHSYARKLLTDDD